MTDVRKLFSSAVTDLAEEEKTPINAAIRDLIRVERSYRYSPKVDSKRLKAIRVIINKYSVDGDEK